MPDTYTSQFSGEEIDSALRTAQIISGASTPAELRNKLEIRGDTIPVSAEDSTLISEALTKIPTTSGGGVNPNLLDNWYFGNPVNQRGQTEYSGDKYTVDRWHLTSDGVLTVADEGIRLTSGALFEPLEYELSSFLKGKTVTYSFFFADNTLVTKSAVIPSTWGNWDSLIEIGDIQLIGLESGKRIWVRYSSTATAVAAKLELGDTQTLAHKENGVWVLNEIPDFGEQLARCQRYYRRWTGADNKPLGVAVRRESKLLELVFSLDTTMRVAPSLTFNGSFACVPTFTWCSVTSIDVATPDTVAVFLKPNDDVTFDLDAYQINIAHANEYIALSADL